MTDQQVIKSLITPNDKTIRGVFSEQKSYFIDIYQREYKWQEHEVSTLLSDIEVRFSQYDFRETLPKEIQKDVMERFEPYFLNTFLTHTTSLNNAIVDGQQRLTTVLLILMKFYLLLKELESNPENQGKTFSSSVIQKLIFETDDFEVVERFKIYNESREKAFQAILDNVTVQDMSDETSKRINENYKIISKYFDAFLFNQESKTFNFTKANYYLTYLLDRISIVEIHIENQKNVAMIFEVVNDRGMGLKPYEILKGKLIGGLPTDKKEEANKIWTNLQDRYYAAVLENTTEASIDLDNFFRTFFRAKFANSESDYESFEGPYHYQMYKNSKIRKFFGDFKDKDLLFKRIKEDIKYFAELYLYLRTTYEDEYLIYNKLLDQNQQYLLILSSVKNNDPDKKSKISGVAKKFDQMHSILRLLNAYGREFQRLIYPLSVALRNKSLPEINSAFDNILLSYLEEANVIIKGEHLEPSTLFIFERFRGISNQWLNFSKYVLMRIDRLLSGHLDKPSYASADLKELEDRFNRNNRKRHGMHLEHIITQHSKNKALFTKEGVFDETEFQQTRNLLGMVLLLKDRQNLSSNDDIYQKKVVTYSMSNLIWNELLVGHIDTIDKKILPADMKIEKIIPTSEGVFPLEKIEERQRAIYHAVRTIWGNEDGEE